MFTVLHNMKNMYKMQLHFENSHVFNNTYIYYTLPLMRDDSTFWYRTPVCIVFTSTIEIHPLIEVLVYL